MAEKLIVALDFDNLHEAMTLVDLLDPTTCALKVGHEMFTLYGTKFVQALIEKQFKVFLDLKFHDIPNTVARACSAAAELGVWMMNVHALGGVAMMHAAKKALESYGNNKPLLIAVTVLTSTAESDLSAIGIQLPLKEEVNHLASLAFFAGLDGVVCSALEVPDIKASCGQSFLTVTPGIRWKKDHEDDQVRIITPEEAIKAGSDYLVVGRPITRAKNPAQAVRDLLLTFDDSYHS